MANNGTEILKRAIDFNSYLREKASLIPYVKIMEPKWIGENTYDPTKTVLSLSGMSGHDLYYYLINEGITPDKQTETAVLILCHISIVQEDVDRLLQSLQKASSYYGKD